MRITRGCWLNSNGKNSIPSFIYTQPYNSLMGPWQCLCSIYKTSKEHSNTVNNMYLEAAQQSEQKLNGHNPASQGWGFPGWAPQNACLHASNASSTFQHNDAHMSLLVCQVSCVEKTPHSDRNISQPVSYTSSSCNTVQRTRVNQAMLTKACFQIRHKIKSNSQSLPYWNWERKPQTLPITCEVQKDHHPRWVSTQLPPSNIYLGSTGDQGMKTSLQTE
jgi:hypothetical protein